MFQYSILGVRTGRNIRNDITQFLILGVRKLKSRAINQSVKRSWNHRTKSGIRIAHLPSQSAFHYSKRSLCYRNFIEPTKKGTERRPPSSSLFISRVHLWVAWGRASEVQGVSLVNWAEERWERNLTSTSNSEIYPTCDSVKPSALIGSQFLHLEKKFGLSNDLFSLVISIW